MIGKISSKWVEVWGAEQIQNQILKGLLVFFLVLCAVESIVLCILALRSPIIVAVTPDHSSVLAIAPATDVLKKEEIRRVVTAYSKAHHSWDWQSVDAQLSTAARMVAPEFTGQFRHANAAQSKIAKEKKLSQKFYISELVSSDKEPQTMIITGDRILVVEGLRATNSMTLQVKYAFGPRTEENPEGIYITSEELIRPSNPEK